MFNTARARLAGMQRVVALVLTLAACAPAQRQPGNPAQVAKAAAPFKPLPALQLSQSHPPGQESQRGQHGRAGKHGPQRAHNQPDQHSQHSQSDWTALFKAWENGCQNSPAFDAFEKRFAFFDRQHGLELGQDENGINGKQLVLDAPERNVKKIPRQKKVVFKKAKAHRAVVSGTVTQTTVTCDDSD